MVNMPVLVECRYSTLHKGKQLLYSLAAPLHTIILLLHYLPSPSMEESEAGVFDVNREH